MAKTPVQIRDIDSRLTLASSAIVELPKIDAPFASIVKRAQVTNFASDLMPRMGIERIKVQNILELDNEVGAGGERVFKATNDFHDQMRFVGTWALSIDEDGQRIIAGASTTDYMEVTFYGTGLNLLTTRNGNRNVAVSVNGGAETTLTAFDGTNSFLGSRKYTVNVVSTMVSGLTLGLHTVKIRNVSSNAIQMCGIEILNESISLKTAPGSAYVGGKKLTLHSLDTQAFNSFENSAVLGTRGGRMVAYLKSDGTIGKAFQPTDASQLNGSNATHVNEELIRTYHMREFGAGRTDDFSLMPTTGTTSRAYTLDDGSTALTGVSINGELESVSLLVNGTGAAKFTFVGTGLDILIPAEIAGTTTYTITVDGIAAGTIVHSLPERATVLRVVSGLPYGSHVVNILRTTATGSTPHISKFMVYGPKKPTIPTGAVELADYYVMADFVANTTAGLDNIATGVLRKHADHEFAYTGTAWTANFTPGTRIAGFEAFSNSNPKSVSYTFVGTGFEVRSFVDTASTVTAATVSLNGTTLTTANFPTITASNYGGVTFTAASGNLSQQSGASQAGAGFRVSGLPFGKYTLRISDASANFLRIETVDVITPVHSPQSYGPSVIQNTLPVGSNSIGDSRVFAEASEPNTVNWAQAIGILSASTGSTAYVPAPDMQIAFKSTGKPLDISFDMAVSHSLASGDMYAALYIDGVRVSTELVIEAYAATSDISQISYRGIFAVPAGVHMIYVMVKTNALTMFMSGTGRILTVREI